MNNPSEGDSPAPWLIRLFGGVKRFALVSVGLGAALALSEGIANLARFDLIGLVDILNTFSLLMPYNAFKISTKEEDLSQKRLLQKLAAALGAGLLGIAVFVFYTYALLFS